MSASTPPATNDADPDLWSRVSPRVLLAGIVLLSGLVYLPTLSFDFVYDDHWTILANGFLRSPEDLSLLLSDQAHARNVPDAFRPTLVAFDMLSYQALGAKPWLHHAVSVLLHVGVVAMLAAWLRGLRAPTALWSSAAALFGVMAIHAEVVTVVSFHEDLLAAGLGLGALTLADASGEAPTGRGVGLRALGAGVLLVLAAGAKLNAIALVGLWGLARLLAPWGRGLGRRDQLPALALIGAAALVIGHRYSIYGGASPYGGVENPRLVLLHAGLGPTMAASAQIHLSYLQQMLVPFGLSPEYVEPPRSWGSPATLVSAAALLGLMLVGLVGAWRRRWPVVALAILGAFGLALPTSNLWPMTNLRADRFMYLPSIAVCIGLAAAAVRGGQWLARGDRGWALLTPLVAMLILQGALAQGAATAYRSDTRLWNTALRRAPGSARAHGIRGQLYVRRLESNPDDPRALNRASAHCSIAQRLAPEQALPWLCGARLAATQRDWPTAHALFERARSRGLDREDRVLAALASVSLDRADLEYEARVAAAQDFANRATRDYPYSALAHATAARIHHRLGDAQRARTLYERASKLRPERWDVVLDRVELELDLGHASAAQTAWSTHEDLLLAADPARRDHVRRRLDDATRLWAP